MSNPSSLKRPSTGAVATVLVLLMAGCAPAAVLTPQSELDAVAAIGPHPASDVQQAVQAPQRMVMRAPPAPVPAATPAASPSSPEGGAAAVPAPASQAAFTPSESPLLTYYDTVPHGTAPSSSDVVPARQLGWTVQRRSYSYYGYSAYPPYGYSPYGYGPYGYGYGYAPYGYVRPGFGLGLGLGLGVGLGAGWGHRHHR